MKIAAVIVNDPLNPTEIQQWFDANPGITLLTIVASIRAVFYIIYK